MLLLKVCQCYCVFVALNQDDVISCFFQDTEIVSLLILIWSYCVFYTKYTVLKFFCKNQRPWAAWCVQKAFTQLVTATVLKRLCILQLIWKLVVSLKNASDHGQRQCEMFFLLQIFESLCHFITKYFHSLKKMWLPHQFLSWVLYACELKGLSLFILDILSCSLVS